ncbi:MAG: hypothetical protein JWP04_1604, partial [Belnapia sp.]|nr:hypothetical protein [Belnapia sp.]
MAQNPNFTFASLIDADYYLGAHPDAARSGLGAAEHYLLSGWKLGYDPNPYFSTGHYLSANPDVAASGTNPLLHYATSGAQEGRSPSILFDQSFYLAHNPDVVASGANPLLHFLRYGAHEGRDPSAFFSVSGYLTANPDVAASGVNPLGHFLQYGWHEGRDPSPHFNTSWYLQQNADVAAAGVNPLEHYLTFGQHESRDPSPNFDTSWYLEQNADVAASGVNPLGHYLQYGVHEHRVPVEPSLSASTPGADEGDTVTYTFSSPGMPAGTVYSYVLSGVQADDVTGPLSGTVTLDAHGQARLAVTLVADATTEGTESMQLTIGGVVGTVAVRDTSLTQTQFFLTADTDSIAGSSYDDTFTATVAGGFAETDRIDGGDGMDTLVATDAAGFSLAALPVLTDVEVARITATAGGITIDTTAWSGLETLELSGDGGNTSATLGADTSVTASFTNVGSANTTIQGGRDVAVTLTGSAGSGVTVGSIAAPTGAVTIHNTSAGDSPMGGITVTGGTSVAITQAVTNAVNTTAYIGLVTVNGTALTTSVSVVAPASVNQSSSVAGVLTSPVSIFDVNNASTTEASTITSVTLENPALAAIFGSAVSELHLRGSMNSVLVGNMSTAVAPATTLGLTLDGVTLGSINEGGIYTTLNIATDGAASTMGNLSMAAVQA